MIERTKAEVEAWREAKDPKASFIEFFGEPEEPVFDGWVARIRHLVFQEKWIGPVLAGLFILACVIAALLGDG